MQGSKGMVIGFAAGLAVAGGTVLLLRDPVAPPTDGAARIDALGAQVERLERSVSLLSANIRSLAETDAARGNAVAAIPVRSDSQPPAAPTVEQQRVIESADSFVDQAIQLGRWTQHQQADLSALMSGLPVEEQGRIQARISAAINNDQIQFDPR